MDKKGRATILAVVVIGVLILGLVMAKPPGDRATKAKMECNDKIDNDGDGNIDREDTGCVGPQDNDETDCGDGVCEGGENRETCPEDCGEPTTTTVNVTTTTIPTTSTTVNVTTTTIADSCSDTDGGDVPTVQGTASGYSGGVPYEYTDFCNSTTILTEFYCTGTDCDNRPYYCPSMNMSCVDGACA